MPGLSDEDPAAGEAVSEPVKYYVRDESSGRWHTATVVGDEEPRYFDGCNITGARELFGELPDDVADEDACDRCVKR